VTTSSSATATGAEKTRALKEKNKLTNLLDEIKTYERTLFEVASEKIALDLDDGVKVNYLKFGKILKTIPGLEAKEEE
jgi:hypothetical protein